MLLIFNTLLDIEERLQVSNIVAYEFASFAAKQCMICTWFTDYDLSCLISCNQADLKAYCCSVVLDAFILFTGLLLSNI